VYRYPQQPAITIVSTPCEKKKRRHRAGNSHKAHPRNRSGNRIRRQHANTVDER
jgi:hypothetical protein